MAIYTIGYLVRESGRTVPDIEEGFLFANKPEARFIGCLLLFLATMSLVCISQAPGAAVGGGRGDHTGQRTPHPFHRHHRSLEATWKYLLICSVGIAMALLGNFFLAYAGHGRVHLRLDEPHCPTPPRWIPSGLKPLS